MPTKETSTLRKVTVNFAPETYDTLAGLANERKVSMSEALRQAIGLMSFIIKTDKDENAKILIERDGKTHELRIL